MRQVLLLILVIGFQIQTYSQSYEIGNDVKRIVFLGNSITYQGQYIAYIDAYFSIHYPEKEYEIINVGLPSETVSGLSEENHAGGAFPRPDLHERLERVLSETKPDLIFSCYGMNDGIYLEFSDDRFEKYKEGVNWLHNEVAKVGAEIIHITPPVYDERKGKAYANVLDIYSDWLISNRYTNDWNVIDIHWPMRKELEAKRIVDSTFVFAKDGIHPSSYGHFFIAREILLNLGETSLINTTDIDSFLLTTPNKNEILSLVNKRQEIMKDAWLTFIGHERPNMTVGLSMEEAMLKSNEIEKQIRILINQ